MNHEEKAVDLTVLAADHDPERWQATLDETLRRVDRVLAARSRDPLSLIASWSRPLTAGAVVAVALLVPVELALELRETEAERVQMLVQWSARTALGEEAPSGADLARAFGPVMLP